MFQTKTATAVSPVTKVVTSESASKTNTSPKSAVNSTAQSPQQAQVVQAVQRVKATTVTLAAATPTKNTIVVANTGQTAQVMTLIIDYTN